MLDDKDLNIEVVITNKKEKIQPKVILQTKEFISTFADVSSAGNGTKDHNRLINRDLNDQHPISAITGLEDELTELQQDITSLSSTVQSYYTTLNTNKVDKEANKSLILNSEIERLATLHNYDDTSLNQAVNNLFNNKVDKVSGKSLISDSEITRLANVTNYDDTRIKQDITSLQTNKADKSQIPIIPKNVSAFSNDAGYLTEHQKLKTINNQSIIGSGNIEIQGGTDGYTKAETDTLLSNKQDKGDYALRSELPTVPTNISSFNNDSGYITSSYHDNTKQDVISNLSTIESNASAGKSASDTISTYGDIVTHNASEFLTEHQDISGKQDKLTAGNYISIARSGAEEKETTTDSFPVSFVANGDNMLNYTIYGNLSQAGTPTPTNPVDVNGVGEIIEITNGTAITNIQLSSPLYKIGDKIDYLDYSTSKVYRKCKKVNLSTLTWTSSVSGGKYRFNSTLSDYVPNVSAGRATNIYFNRFSYATTDNYGVGFGHANKNVYIYVDSTVQTVAQLQTWLANNNSYIVYPINETVEETATLPALPTNNGANELNITGLKPSSITIKYPQGSGGDLTISTDLKLVTGYDKTKTQVLKHINGVMQWITE